MRNVLDDLRLQVQWQQVEDGRANVLATWPGPGGGPSLMFNGHTDTSYSGREPWLRDIPGFQPEGFEREGRIYGLGISNMKGALACYVEALRSLIDAGVRLKGDLLIAAVAGEIEKTQQGADEGDEFRGYAAGEPGRARALRLALAAALDGRAVHPHGVQRRPTRRELDPPHAPSARRSARMAPGLGGADEVRRRARRGERRRHRGRLRLARVADATSHRSLPRLACAARRADRRRAARGARVRALAGRRGRGGVRDRAGRGDRGGSPARRRARRVARRSLRLAPRA